MSGVQRGHYKKVRNHYIAGLPLLDFTGFARERQEEYFAAVRHGLDRNFKPMEGVFRTVIDRSMEAYGG
ncbi:MAG TPA: hypothetical protein ENK84_02395 [Desulfobulbus sp.]|nr:hypothetical protein [Desulfobulbus sp.]